MIEIIIPGLTPVAWSRAGILVRQGKPRLFTRPSTRSYKDTLALFAASAMGSSPPLQGPLSMICRFSLPIPESWTRLKRNEAESGDLLPTGRPDIDNYVKAVADALNGIAWTDDAQVVEMRASKRYAPEPGVYVRIEPL